MTATIYTLPNLPAALIAESGGRWYALQAPWQCAWVNKREIPRPRNPEPVKIYTCSPLAVLSDIPSIVGGRAR